MFLLTPATADTVKQKCKAVAGVLATAFLSLSLSGCRAVTSLSNKDLGDVLISIGRLFGILPENTEVITIKDFFIEKWGQSFAEIVEQWVIKAVSVPPLSTGILGVINKAFALLGFGLAIIFIIVYFKNYRKWEKLRGKQAVEDGLTPVIPRNEFFPKRLLPVLLVIVLGLGFLQLSLMVANTIVVELSQAFFLDRGETIGQTSLGIMSEILDGADIWVFAALSWLIIPAALVFLMFYAANYLVIEAYYWRMMIQAPASLSGTNYKHLSEPIFTLFKRVVVLSTRQLALFMGVLVVAILSDIGIPVAIGVFLMFIAAIALPFILYGWWKPTRNWFDEGPMGWFDDLDHYPVDPSVLPEEWEDPGFLKRIWLRQPRFVRGFWETQAGIASSLVNMHPQLAPLKETANIIREGREVISGERDLEETVAARVSGQQPPPPKPHDPVQNIEADEMELLEEKARAAGLDLSKDRFDDSELAIAAELHAMGLTTSDDELRTESRRYFKSMNKQEKNYWKQRGWRLRRRI